MNARIATTLATACASLCAPALARAQNAPAFTDTWTVLSGFGAARLTNGVTPDRFAASPTSGNSNLARHYTGIHGYGGLQLEIWGAHHRFSEYTSAFGTGVGMHLTAHAGYVANTYEAPAGTTLPTSHDGSATLHFSGGPILQLLRVDGFGLAAHVTLGADFSGRWYTPASLFAGVGGRMIWQAGLFRLRAQYDYAPFWAFDGSRGNGRVSHEASVYIGIKTSPRGVAVGVRGLFGIGQQRVQTGDAQQFTGFTEWTAGAGVEIGS